MTCTNDVTRPWPSRKTAQHPASASGIARKPDPFLKGPICLQWLARAVRLRKPALPAGLALWFLRGVTRGSAGPFKITQAVRRRVRLSGPQMLRGLRALEAAKLVRFIKSGRGRCAVVEIIDLTPYPSGKPPSAVGNRQEMDLRDHLTAL